ncbi:MAG TPA: PfkB family carbohydrate kinase [Candidatus Binatus sp.]|uniref:PfkB family carbohydrate kinase n=1 Tax=Candidatus Binatus sp. TaxID=2811406 RepID=UPI002B4605D3|nr:PfkB family carbohydrate kinase [Candidatus Binatus sp.]HKN12912.1 PfkB family carbohydrate kinase [Candidatus Binatus sp.]
MSIVVVGFLAYDTVETPNGKVEEVLGGGASYFSIAARFFSPVSIVAVVGSDFKAEDLRLFTDRNIDVRGVAKREGKTTRWHGRYHEDMNVRDTVALSLNVLENFTPQLLPDQCRADYLYLAPNDPALQEHVLDQVLSPKVVVADLYDYWIENTRPGLAKVLERIQILLCSDNEARVLTGEHNLVKAGRAILEMGPATVLIKRGEYGVLQFSDEGMFAVPAYPLEEVVDPTGAGDTFAGAVMGFLARHGRVTESSLRTAVVYGSVMASYVVERFSLERLLDLTWEQIDSRYREFINLIDSHHSRWTTQ